MMREKRDASACIRRHQAFALASRVSLGQLQGGPRIAALNNDETTRFEPSFLEINAILLRGGRVQRFEKAGHNLA